MKPNQKKHTQEAVNFMHFWRRHKLSGNCDPFIKLERMPLKIFSRISKIHNSEKHNMETYVAITQMTVL